MEKFLNFYTKYPWVAIIIVVHWFATAISIIYGENIDVTKVMGMAFVSTVIFAYFGFKVPKS